jgi:lysophospholipase
MDLVSIPANPVPEGGIVGAIKTRDGRNLRFARWDPPPGRKGTVCIFQGRAEFIEKYFEVVRELRSRGFAVALLDWRGQGQSDRALADLRKGHVGDFSEFEIDVEEFMNQVVLPDCPPPIFAIGHSMGGAVIMLIARHGNRWFDRVVLSAPMIRLGGARSSAHYKIAVRVMRLAGLGSAYVPGGSGTILAMGAYTGNPATSDPVRYARTKAVLEVAPELGLGSPTVSWLNAAYRAMGEIVDPTYPNRVRLPLMLIGAGRDEIVSTAAIEGVAIQLRAGSHLVIAGAKHELMMEQDRYRQQFWAAFDAFVPGTPLY